MTAELDHDEPAFDSLLVQGAQAMQALASRSQQLTELIAQTATTTGAIARQTQNLQQALQLLPGTLTHADEHVRRAEQRRSTRSTRSWPRQSPRPGGCRRFARA